MGFGKAWGKSERFMIPTLPICMAVFCCILNFIIPGLGTIIAAFANLCCHHNKDMGAGEKFCSCCLNVFFGFAQLLTCLFFFLGWIWSGFWGVTMVIMSIEYYHKEPTTAAPAPTTTTYIQQTVTHPGPPGGYVAQPGYPQAASYPQPGYPQPGYGYGVPQPGADAHGQMPPPYSGPAAPAPSGPPHPDDIPQKY